MIYPFTVIGFVLIFTAGCYSQNDGAARPIAAFSNSAGDLPVMQRTSPDYAIDSGVLTTIDRTIIPVAVPSTAAKIFPYELAKYPLNGYGVWKFGPGLACRKRLDLMPAAYTGTRVKNETRLLNFFTMTDIHLTDKESPAQGIFYGYKGGIISAYSGIMLYTDETYKVRSTILLSTPRKEIQQFLP